jgi:hypothetical protein
MSIRRNKALQLNEPAQNFLYKLNVSMKYSIKYQPQRYRLTNLSNWGIFKLLWLLRYEYATTATHVTFVRLVAAVAFVRLGAAVTLGSYVWLLSLLSYRMSGCCLTIVRIGALQRSWRSYDVRACREVGFPPPLSETTFYSLYCDWAPRTYMSTNTSQ